MATFSAAMSGDSRYIADLIVNETSQDISANTTSISILLRVRYTGSLSTGSWTDTAQTWSRMVYMGTVSGTWTYDFRTYASKNLNSSSTTVTHNADGTKTITIQATVYLEGKGSAVINTTMTLTPIPRGMVYIRAANDAGPPVRGQVFIGNDNGVPVQAQEVWIGDANGVPRRSI